ncbi:hypothetical protein [Cupriavidus pauculus]|uniref:hypothetical protein n=1 Tax=Cupriavidus pauculus TaxID=82633 RepID=UPI001EE376F4|nr:hypothetical protein [Cupriavidus pauculus]GJG97332.1 hypothetical protein CBA19C6_22605 [Cupriavidus pauculus]
MPDSSITVIRDVGGSCVRVLITSVWLAVADLLLASVTVSVIVYERAACGSS